MTLDKFIDFIDYNEDIIKEKLKQPIDYDNFPTLCVPDSFSKTNLNLKKENYSTLIRKQIEPIASLAEKNGFSPNIYTALYEVILNGFQHANNYDESKLLRVSNRINDKSLEIIVEDQGEKLPEYFIPFLLKVRKEKSREGSFVDWYSFSCANRNKVNQGTGTSFIHAYMDDVKYMRSNDLGGLAVYLYKEK